MNLGPTIDFHLLHTLISRGGYALQRKLKSKDKALILNFKSADIGYRDQVVKIYETYKSSNLFVLYNTCWKLMYSVQCTVYYTVYSLLYAVHVTTATCDVNFKFVYWTSHIFFSYFKFLSHRNRSCQDFTLNIRIPYNKSTALHASLCK